MNACALAQRPRSALLATLVSIKALIVKYSKIWYRSLLLGNGKSCNIHVYSAPCLGSLVWLLAVREKYNKHRLPETLGLSAYLTVLTHISVTWTSAFCF